MNTGGLAKPVSACLLVLSLICPSALVWADSPTSDNALDAWVYGDTDNLSGDDQVISHGLTLHPKILLNNAQQRLQVFNSRIKQALENNSQININGMSIRSEDDWTWHYLDDYDRQKSGITPLDGGLLLEYEFKY